MSSGSLNWNGNGNGNSNENETVAYRYRYIDIYMIGLGEWNRNGKYFEIVSGWR